MSIQDQLDDLQALNEVVLEDECAERDSDETTESDAVLWWENGISWCRTTG
jgi:hypothetical protein